MAAVRGAPTGTRPANLTAPAEVGEDPFADLPDLGNSPALQTGPQALPPSPEAPTADDPFAALPDLGGPAPAAEEPPAEQGALASGLDTASRVLDYPGGFIRSGLAEVAGVATGQPGTVTPADLKAAAKGKAPESAEYLRRLGVPEGGSLNLPGLGKVTTRGAAGLALDVLTDPLTAVAKLAKGYPAIGKALNSAGSASEAVGEALYRSALKKVDEKLIARGGDAVSDLLLREGAPVGSLSQLATKVDEMASTMGKLRQGLYDKAASKGVTIDMAYPMKRAEGLLKEMKADPGLAPSAAALEDLLARYKQAGKVSIDQLSEWKTHLYESLPQSAFEGFGKLKGSSKKFKAALAADFREAIISAGNKAERGLGDGINALNEKWGTLLAAKKPLSTPSILEGGEKLGAGIDGILLGTGNVGPFAAKKAAELMTTPYAKTLAGKALMEAGKKGAADALSRRAVIQSGRAVQAGQEEPVDFQQ